MRLYDLGRLLKLRELRIERAEHAVLAQRKVLGAAETALETARLELTEHDAAQSALEQRFLYAILQKPHSHTAIARQEDRSLLSRHHRTVLDEAERAARERLEGEERKLKDLIAIQFMRRRENEKLLHTAGSLRHVERRKEEALSELENDESSNQSRKSGNAGW